MSVLILRTDNSARSQMAEAFLRHLPGHDFDVESAGVSPSHVRPEAIEVMEEIGIPMIDQYSKSVEKFVGKSSFTSSPSAITRRKVVLFSRQSPTDPLEFLRSRRSRRH